MSELNLPQYHAPTPQNMHNNNGSSQHEQSPTTAQEHDPQLCIQVDILSHTYNQYSTNTDRLATILQRPVETQDLVHNKYLHSIAEVHERLDDISQNINNSRRASSTHEADINSEAIFIGNNTLSENRKKADYFTSMIISNWQPKLFQPASTQVREKKPCSLEIINKLGYYLDIICTIPTLRTQVRELLFERFGELCTPFILQKFKTIYARENITLNEETSETHEDNNNNTTPVPEYPNLNYDDSDTLIRFSQAIPSTTTTTSLPTTEIQWTLLLNKLFPTTVGLIKCKLQELKFTDFASMEAFINYFNLYSNFIQEDSDKADILLPKIPKSHYVLTKLLYYIKFWLSLYV